LLFHSIAHRHQALLIVLRDRGTMTSQQYEEAVKERLAELKQTLERGH